MKLAEPEANVQSGSRRPRVAVLWPRPRAARWRLGETDPEKYPDLSDALLFLQDVGFAVEIEDSLSFPLNPLTHLHELYSGLDPVRCARVLTRLSRYDALIIVGDSAAMFIAQARHWFGIRLPILLIDPALSYNYPKRRWIQDKILPFVDRVVVFSRSQLDYLTTEYGDRVAAVIVPHRADARFYTPATPASPGASPMMLSVGNDAARDFATLARAVERAPAMEQPGASCLIHTTRELDLAGTKVKRSGGSISFVELRELYRSADVLALPLDDTIHPGGVNTLLEGMACGCPIVVSDSRGIRDYVRHEETALVVKPGDPDAMASAIDRLLRDREAARDMGLAARRFVEQTCDNRTYARSIGEILRQIIGQPSAQGNAAVANVTLS